MVENGHVPKQCRGYCLSHVVDMGIEMGEILHSLS
jgi:hypothetical protein